MTTKTLENKTFCLMNDRIYKDHPLEKFQDEMLMIRGAIKFYGQIGKLNEQQTRDLSNRLIEQAIVYANIRENERLAEKADTMRRMRAANLVYAH